MSQKAQLPSLTGHKLKTRKRDERKQYDPSGFRDTIIEGLNEANGNLELVSKFLDNSNNKLDYRRYGVTLVEILVAGGLLAPGGIIINDGDDGLWKTDTCLFGMVKEGAEDNMVKVKAWEQIFLKLTRRFKYLEKMHEEEMQKILVYLKGFTPVQRKALAQIMALWLASGQIPPTILPVLINEHQVKDGTALEFILVFLATIKAEKGSTMVVNMVKKSGLETRMMDFFPLTNHQQTEDNFAKTFLSVDLPEIVTFRRAQAGNMAKKELQGLIKFDIEEEKPVKEIIVEIKDAVSKTAGIQEQDTIVMIWSSVMSSVEWNKKEDLLQEQALRHLKKFIPLFSAFTNNAKSELALLNKIQEYCYDNMNFLKTFNKIVLLFYKTEILSEEVVLKWYKDGHSQRGWSVFMDQMKKFIEWLQSADEGEKRQRRAFSDPVLCCIAGMEFHPWITGENWEQFSSADSFKRPRINLLEKIEAGAKLSLVHAGKMEQSSELTKNLELFLEHPGNLFLKQDEKINEQFITIVLEILKKNETKSLNDEDLNLQTELFKKIWNGFKCGKMKNCEEVAVKSFESFPEMFRDEVEDLYLKHLEDEENVDKTLLEMISRSKILFVRFLELSLQLFVHEAIRCDPNLAKSFRILSREILKFNPNPSTLFPIFCQHFVLVLNLNFDPSSKINRKEEKLLDMLVTKSNELYESNPEMLKILFMIFPEKFKTLILHSVAIKSSLHVKLIPSNLTINEVFNR